MKGSVKIAVSTLGLAAVVGLILVARAPDDVDDEKSSTQAGVATSGEAGNHSNEPQRAAGERRNESADESRMPAHHDQPVVAEPSAFHARPRTQDESLPPAAQSSPQPDIPRASAANVKGRSFPVSASVIANCAPSDGRRPSIFCEPNQKLLEAIAEEPRNESWASAAERAIRDLVEQEPGKYTIRALECRSSVCFVETASPFEAFHSPLYRSEKSSGLKAGYPISGTEVDEYGSTV